MRQNREGRDERAHVLASTFVALAGTVAYELLKETFLPAISRWGSHVLTITYVTFAAAAIATVVHRHANRMRREVQSLQGWGARSEAALQAFVDAIPEPAFLVNRQLAILTLNDALASRLGRARADLVGRDAFALLPDSNLARARAARVTEVFDQGNAIVFHDSNNDRHYVNHLGPVRGPDDGVWAVGVVAIDVTDLHRAQEQLEQKEELLRFGLEAAGLGVWEWDIGTDVVSVSSQAIRLLGGPEREWRGSFASFLQHVEADDRGFVEEWLRTSAAGRAMSGPLTFRGRTNLRRPLRWVEVQGRLFKGRGGRLRMVGTVADATARRESEARRLRTEDALQSVTQRTAGHTGQDFFSSLVAALARSLGARWVLAGRATDDDRAVTSLACWANGPAPECSMPLEGPLDEATGQRWLSSFAAATGAADGDPQEETPSAVIIPIVSPDGTTVGIVGALHDKPLGDIDTVRLVLALTAMRAGAEIQRLDKENEIMRLNADLERRVLERTTELTSANRELEAFSYSVSHDLRAPLRSIDGFALALVEDHGDKLEPEARQYIQIVRQESQRMGQLIDDLIGLARLTRSTLNRAPVNLSATATAIIDELRLRHPERSVAVTIAPDMIVHGDANLLRIALDNLLGNAWKFTSRTADARIEVGMSETTPHAKVFVSDNGAGFDSKLAGKLFQPFARLHHANEYEGTGIGLATVARIIKRHGGCVTAESSPGNGATFTWTLPAAGASPSPSARTTERDHSGPTIQT